MVRLEDCSKIFMCTYIYIFTQYVLLKIVGSKYIILKCL